MAMMLLITLYSLETALLVEVFSAQLSFVPITAGILVGVATPELLLLGVAVAASLMEAWSIIFLASGGVFL